MTKDFSVPSQLVTASGVANVRVLETYSCACHAVVGVVRARLQRAGAGEGGVEGGAGRAGWRREEGVRGDEERDGEGGVGFP